VSPSLPLSKVLGIIVSASWKEGEEDEQGTRRQPQRRGSWHSDRPQLHRIVSGITSDSSARLTGYNRLKRSL
jgi:hypothetical protein